MKTIAIKMKTYAGNVNIVDNSDLEKKVLNLLFMTLGLLALVYVCLLGSMVFNIVERKSAEAEARTLGNEVADLQLQYLSMCNKIDLALSASLGFKETKIAFTSEKTLGRLNAHGPFGNIKLTNGELYF